MNLAMPPLCPLKLRHQKSHWRRTTGESQKIFKFVFLAKGKQIYLYYLNNQRDIESMNCHCQT